MRFIEFSNVRLLRSSVVIFVLIWSLAFLQPAIAQRSSTQARKNGPPKVVDARRDATPPEALKQRALDEWRQFQQAASRAIQSPSHTSDDVPRWAIDYVRGTLRPNWLEEQVIGRYGEQVRMAARRLRSLDGANRKQHLSEIPAVGEVLLQFLPPIDSDSPSPLVDTYAEVLYRIARSYAYRDLPGAENGPNYDAIENGKLFDATVDRIRSLVDMDRPEYLALAMRYDRRHGRPDLALAALLDSEDQRRRLGVGYLFDKKRRDLYQELNWTDLAQKLNTHLRSRYGTEDQIKRILERAKQSILPSIAR